MGTLMKTVAFAAPVLFLILAIVFFMNREHKVEMDKDSQEFEQGWNTSMQHFAKSPAEKQAYAKKAQQAQSRYSAASIELSKRTSKVDQVENNLDKTLDNIDQKGDLK